MSPLILTLPEAKGQGFVAGTRPARPAEQRPHRDLMLGAPSVGFTVALQGVRPFRIDEIPAVERPDPRRRDLRVELRARDVVFALAPASGAANRACSSTPTQAPSTTAARRCW